MVSKYPTTEVDGQISTALKDQFGSVSKYLEWSDDNRGASKDGAYWSARLLYTMLAIRELDRFYGKDK